jgi:hypothetical protein
MSTRFIQANCIEGKRVDPRQAEVVKKYKPDIIFFEMPAFKNRPASPFNAYGVTKKPFAKVEKIKVGLRREAKRTPYAGSDVLIWDAVELLWRAGHNTLLFNIDAPQRLRHESFMRYRSVPLARQKRQWQFWIYLYIREAIMARHMESILKKYSKRKDLTVAVFLQNIHWQHVRFLLEHPSKEKVWNYYFGKFPGLTPATVAKTLTKENPALYQYWKKSGLV